MSVKIPFIHQCVTYSAELLQLRVTSLAYYLAIVLLQVYCKRSITSYVPLQQSLYCSYESSLLPLVLLQVYCKRQEIYHKLRTPATITILQLRVQLNITYSTTVLLQVYCNKSPVASYPCSNPSLALSANMMLTVLYCISRMMIEDGL